jgi:hypothetical protein
MKKYDGMNYIHEYGDMLILLNIFSGAGDGALRRLPICFHPSKIAA